MPDKSEMLFCLEIGTLNYGFSRSKASAEEQASLVQTLQVIAYAI